MDKEDLIKITTNINKNSCPEHTNFHCHTKFSDGSLEPQELLDQVFFNKLKLSKSKADDKNSIFN